MKKFLSTLLLAATLCFAAENTAHAQKSNLRVGDGGTNIRLIKIVRATLVSGTVTVTDAAVTTAANVIVYRQSIGGTPGVTYPMTARSAGSFTITAKAADGTTTVTTDTSVLAYYVFWSQ